MDKATEKLKSWVKNVIEAVNRPLNVAFPETSKKHLFLIIMGVLELLLLYLVAVIDVGLWNGDSSISGMLAAYILSPDQKYPFFMFIILSVILWVVVYKMVIKQVNGNTGRGFDISDSNVYGSAREINMEELEQITEIVSKKEAMGNILGQLDKTETKLITQKPIANFNNNLLCLAPPGSGKTATIVLPTIIQAIRRGESIVTTDTKGEVWSKTVELARRHGYTVRRFDIKDPTMSDGWDILGELKQSHLRAQIAATTVMKNTSLAQGSDPFVSAEHALLTALMLAMDLDKDIPPEHKSLTKATLDILPEGAAALDSKFNILKDLPDMNVAYRFYSTYITGSPNARSNVILNLSNRLNFLASPSIQEMTSTPDIDMTLPGKEKCIYYVVLPDQHDTMKVLSSLFFSFLFLDLCDFADAQPSQRLPVPVNIMIEEAYACGELPTITNALATVRSRGISISLVAQGIKQFHMLYGEDMTSSILECCATYACLGTNTEETAELFEWLSGHATVKVKTEQHHVGEGILGVGKNYSTGDGRQHLYSGNDIRKLKFGEIFLVWQRFDPLKAFSFFYKRHPEYENGHMPEISGHTSVPLTNKKAKAYMREMEEKRVREYQEWIANGDNPWKGYVRPEPPAKGAATGTDFPPFIPYPLLEEMALAHSNLQPKPSQKLEDIQNKKIDTPTKEYQPEANHEKATEQPQGNASVVETSLPEQEPKEKPKPTQEEEKPVPPKEKKAEAAPKPKQNKSKPKKEAAGTPSEKTEPEATKTNPNPETKADDKPAKPEKKEKPSAKPANSGKGGKARLTVTAVAETEEEEIPRSLIDMFGVPGEEEEIIKTTEKKAEPIKPAASSSLLLGAQKITK